MALKITAAVSAIWFSVVCFDISVP